MSFFTGNNYCDKCGKPLSIFEQGLCAECEKAEKAEQDKCEHKCEECEHNDGECCRILFERSFEQLRTEVERATIEMDYETAQEALAVIDRYMEHEPCDDVVSRQNIIDTYESCADMLSDEELEGANLVMRWVYKAPPVRLQEPIPEQWQELKETIIELRDNDGTGTQQEVCRYLARYMDVLEKQMVEPQESEE